MKTNSVLTEKNRLPGRAETLSIVQLTTLARRVDYNATRLAGELHVSRMTLVRRFHETFACAPGEWLAQQRMRDAVLLLERGFTIKEVRGALGYQQTPQFCREFRRRLGCTPSQFVAQHPTASKLRLQISVSPILVQTANLLVQTANAPDLPRPQAA